MLVVDKAAQGQMGNKYQTNHVSKYSTRQTVQHEELTDEEGAVILFYNTA